MKVLVDTNFFLLAKHGIDIYSQLEEPFTLSACIAELERIAAGRGRDAGYARLALQLAKEKKLKIVRTAEKNADSAIKKYSLARRCAVATNDKALIKYLKGCGIRIARMRQKSHVVWE